MSNWYKIVLKNGETRIMDFAEHEVAEWKPADPCTCALSTLAKKGQDAEMERVRESVHFWPRSDDPTLDKPVRVQKIVDGDTGEEVPIT